MCTKVILVFKYCHLSLQWSCLYLIQMILWPWKYPYEMLWRRKHKQVCLSQIHKVPMKMLCFWTIFYKYLSLLYQQITLYCFGPFQPRVDKTSKRYVLPDTRAVVRSWQPRLVFNNNARGRGSEQNAESYSRRTWNSGIADQSDPCVLQLTYFKWPFWLSSDWNSLNEET